MTQTIKFCLCFAMIAACSGVAIADNVARTVDGKQVTRLVFDREQVTVIYADGTVETSDYPEIVWAPETSGVYELNVDNRSVTTDNGTYDLQGRRINPDNAQPGVYVERRDGKTVKVIKK